MSAYDLVTDSSSPDIYDSVLLKLVLFDLALVNSRVENTPEQQSPTGNGEKYPLNLFI